MPKQQYFEQIIFWGLFMLSKACKLTAALIAMLLWSFPAKALEVEEAGVEKGDAELVYEGSYTDENSEGVYEHEHEIEAELGINDWLKLALGVGFEEEEGERDFDFSEVEIAATIEIVDPEQGGTGLALFTRLSKEFAPDEEPDEEDVSTFAIGAIAEQHFNNWLIRGNLFYVTDIDSEEAENKFDGIEYAYRISYQLNESFGLGVEGYGQSISPDEGDDEDTHMVGPVIYYERELGNRHERHSVKDDDGDDDDEEEGMEFEAQLGVLFGTTDETADITFKWNLGLEF